MSVLVDGWIWLLRSGAGFPIFLLFCLALIVAAAALGPPDESRPMRDVTPRRKQLGGAETRLRRWRD